MTRWLLPTVLLLACTKARTDNAATGSSVAPSIAAPATSDAAVATAPTVDASVLDASLSHVDSRPEQEDRGIAVERIGPEGRHGTVEMWKDPTPITPSRSIADDFANQLGGARTPAKGGRSLTVIMRAVALDTSSLDAGEMQYEYVARGRADVKGCFESLRAKDPGAKGEITLRFTVDTTGAVVRSEVTGFNSELSKCVETAMPRWRFTAPNKPTRFELVVDLVIG